MKKSLISLALVAAAAGAQAGVITTTVIGPSINLGTGSTILSLPYYTLASQAGSPLQSATLTLFGGATLGLFVTNNTIGTVNYDINGSAQLSYLAPAAPSATELFLVNRLGTAPQLIVADSKTGTLGPNTGNLVRQFQFDLTATANRSWTFSGNDLNHFISAGGNFSLSCSGDIGGVRYQSRANPAAGTIAGGFGGQNPDGAATSYCGASISYSVPEPASIALTGLALLGVGALTRRRKA